MEWLTLWLKKIILLVLLAAFLDLILPNTSLQRYVRMVMGLIVLLTILTPVFSLFQLSPDEVALKLSRYQMNGEAQEDENEWRSLANRLSQQQDEQMTAYVESQMEALIQQQVRQDYGVEVAAVDVEFSYSRDKEPEIQFIRVLLGNQQAGANRQTDGIQPVEPVRIEIGESASGKQQSAVEAAVRPDRSLTRQIAQAVARNWSVEIDQVDVVPDEADLG